MLYEGDDNLSPYLQPFELLDDLLGKKRTKTMLNLAVQVSSLSAQAYAALVATSEGNKTAVVTTMANRTNMVGLQGLGHVARLVEWRLAAIRIAAAATNSE